MDKDFFSKIAQFLINLPQKTEKLYLKLAENKYPLTMFAYISSAFFTGLFCVVFMESFTFIDTHRLSFKSVGIWAFLLAPAFFILSANIVRWLAPYACGSGIPQVIFAIKNPQNLKTPDMVSVSTMLIKIISIFLGVWAGASVGREGPTVQIGACFFWLCIRTFSFFIPIHADRSTAVIAGGSAGLAAAFNTPLAGVTFAIEELASKHFENIKDYALMAIIVAAISAQILTGDYIYFGKLSFSKTPKIADLMFIAILCGIAGAFFSKLILYGTKRFSLMSKTNKYFILPALGALIVAGLALFAGESIQGPGNIAAGDFLKGKFNGSPLFFAVGKFFATITTYISGIAGGLFAPSLSIGSAAAASMANFVGMDMGTAAVLGMAAFLSAVIQAPITAFIIVFEMTGHSQMLLPIMLSSLISYMVSKALKAKPLYASLAERYLN